MRQKTSTGYFIIFILLFTIYYLQGILYPNGSLLSQSVLVIIALMGIPGVVRVLSKRMNVGCVKMMLLFTALITITFLVSPKVVVGRKFEAIGMVSTFGQFKTSLVFCMGFFIGIYAGKHKIPDRAILISAIIVTVLNIIDFLYKQQLLTDGRSGATINVAYQFIGALPLLALLFRKYKFTTLALLCVYVIFIVLGAKRGAIVCLIVAVFYSFYWFVKSFKVTPRKIVAGLFILMALLGLGIHQYSTNDYLQDRMDTMERKGIGGREIGYATMTNNWIKNPDITEQMFGKGTAQTVTVWGNYGHNDWLELLIDNGVLGVTIYALLFLSFMVYTRRISRVDPYYYLAASLCLLTWFCKTCFSMGYSELYSCLSMSVLGYCVERTCLRYKQPVVPQLNKSIVVSQ